MGLLRRSELASVKELILTVISNTNFANALADSIDSTEADKLAKHVVNVSHLLGNTLSLIHSLLELEFVRCSFNQGAIMRGNSIASKIMTCYCRRFGADYVNTLLGDILNKTVSNQALNLEVDPKQLKGENLEKQQELLTTWVQQYFDRVVSNEMVNSMPRNIRAMAGFIANLAKKHAPAQLTSLVGGFIMLRFINPCLVTPESFFPINLSIRDRRNLTLITKALQNISNTKDFKEEWMLPLNKLVHGNKDKMDAYLLSVASDPNGKEWEDLASPAALRDFNSIGNNELSAEEYDFFIHIFTVTNQKFIDALNKLEGNPPGRDALVSKLAELKNEKSKGGELLLTINPVDPVSRTVHVFCSELGVPVKLKSVDPFSRSVGSLTNVSYPTLTDGTTELQELGNITAYLDKEFLIPSQWLKAPEGKEAEWKELMQWITTELLVPLATIAGNFIWKSKRWLDEEVFKDEYAKVHAALAQANAKIDPKFGMLDAKVPNLLDLYFCVVISLTLVVPGTKLPILYPKLNAYFVDVSKRYKTWTTVNREFQHFVKFVEVIVIADENLFPESIIYHTITLPYHTSVAYEYLLDPDTPKDKLVAMSEQAQKEEEAKNPAPVAEVSVKKEEEKKKGWFGKKKGKKDDSAQSKLKLSLSLSTVPKPSSDAITSARSPRTPNSTYKVSKEVGGKFTINGREGTNIFLVPGMIIFQESSHSDWGSERSLELFEILPLNSGSSKIIVRQVDIPAKHLATTEERWEKTWKQMDAIRVVDLHQVVFFIQTKPGDLFEMFTNVKKLSKMTKVKGKMEKDGTFELMNRTVVGRVVQADRQKGVVQEWRMHDWPEGHYSTMNISIIALAHAFGTGCHMNFRQSNVPFDKSRATMKFHKNNIWKKLEGLWSLDVNQQVVINMPTKELYETWTDSDKLSAKLQAPCTLGKDKGEAVEYLNRLISGVYVHLEAPKKIAFTYMRRQWRGYQEKKHKSTATLDFYDLSEKGLSGTLVVLSHTRLPLKFVKQVEEAWPNEFWKKFNGLLVETYQANVPLRIKKQALFDLLLDSKAMTELTGASCTINKQIKIFKMYNDSVAGTIAEETSDTLRLHWKHKDWPEEHYSDLTITFEEHKKPALNLVHRFIPASYIRTQAEQWDEFLKRLAAKQ